MNRHNTGTPSPVMFSGQEQNCLRKCNWRGYYLNQNQRNGAPVLQEIVRSGALLCSGGYSRNRSPPGFFEFSIFKISRNRRKTICITTRKKAEKELPHLEKKRADTGTACREIKHQYKYPLEKSKEVFRDSPLIC